MAEKFGFYDHCLFHTTVEETDWDEDGRPLDRRDRSRRQDAGAVRDPRQRHPDHAEAGAHRGHGEVQGRGVPHLALELQRRSARASGSASSAPARPPCRRSPNSRRSSRSSTSSSARPRRSTCATSARPPRRRRQTWAKEPGWARARRARFAKISAGRTAMQANDDYLAGKVADFKERKQYERAAHARRS